MAEITIRNIKNIAQLEFDIPRSGVNVLTGSNGAGKTTLMTCLERLTNPNAFKKYFKHSTHIQFDSFINGEIIYEFNGSAVTYKYSNSRWQPTPAVNTTVLQNFGFRDVLFIASNDDRFYIQEQELNTRNIQAASPFFREGMNLIFQTNRFDELRRIKIEGRGRRNHRRNYAFLLLAASEGGQNRYFSEKNFSLGEILILNALFQLATVEIGSLVLIDEVELALHPKVQVKFLQFLQSIAVQKQLSIMISTHSTSLIKAAPKLIHLEKDEMTGNTKINYDCYPAVALQDVAFEDEIQPDFIFFVEDEHAKLFLENLIEYYFNQIILDRTKPLYKILPVAGWSDTIRFLKNSIATLIPRNVKSFAFLDYDVSPLVAAIQANPNRSENEQAILNLYNAHSRKIKFLPITPELGVVNYLNSDTHQQVQAFRQFLNLGIDLSELIYTENGRGFNYPQNPRAEAKKRFDYYTEYIAQAGNWDKKVTQTKLYQYYTERYARTNRASIQELLGPIFND